jgi:hypothetical protein
MGTAHRLIWMWERRHDRCSTSLAKKGKGHRMDAATAIHEMAPGSPESLRHTERYSYRQKLGWNLPQ